MSSRRISLGPSLAKQAAANERNLARLAKSLRAKVLALETAIRRNPDDQGLRLTLRSARRLAARAEEALNAAEISKRVDE